MDRLSEYISRFNNATVLVVGDIIADHYVWGKVERISPEAPGPIVDVQSESFMLGGAGEVTGNILERAIEYNLCIIVDPKLKHFDFYTGATVITPNTSEALIASGLTITDDETLLKAGNILLKQSNAEAVLITRSEHGMSLFQRNNDVIHIPAVAREVYDVTGAGDTVVSTLALSVAAGASLSDAAILANYAGGIVVGIVGTATVHKDQLIAALHENPP